MKLRTGFLLILFSIVVAFAGQASAAGWANPHLLLTPDQVEKNVSKSDWVVVDCRPLKDYLKGHIPGAISLGKRCDKKLRDATARAFRNPGTYENIFGKVGIGNNTHVVFYHGDIKTLTRATVAFWVMEYLGHTDKAHLLNGGLEAWNAAGKKLDAKPTIKDPTRFKAKVVHSRLAETAEILKIARGELKNVQLIDSRTEKEYKGKDMRAVRAGHVPNVILNVSHITTVDKKKKGDKEVPTGYLSPEVVGAKFASLDKNKRTIGYCQTGTRSTLTYLQFRLLGFKDSANWDESWRVYGSHPDGYPIAGEQYFNFAQFRKMNKKIKALEKAVFK